MTLRVATSDLGVSGPRPLGRRFPLRNVLLPFDGIFPFVYTLCASSLNELFIVP